MKDEGDFVRICNRFEEIVGLDDAMRLIRAWCDEAAKQRVYTHAGPPAPLVDRYLRRAVTSGTSVEVAAAAVGISRATAYRHKKRWVTGG